MATSKTRSKFLTVRLTEQEHKAFGVKAKAYGGTSFVVRELVEAFLEDRLTVKPSPTKRSLYHVTRK
jgi:hypothetical protein